MHVRRDCGLRRELDAHGLGGALAALQRQPYGWFLLAVTASGLLAFGAFELEVLGTPGHTPGGLSFKVGNHVFSGDTLLPGKIGRVDLPGSSPQQMLLSLHGQLLTLPDNTVIYPGHGPNTTIGAERVGNPYLRVR